MIRVVLYISCLLLLTQISIAFAIPIQALPGTIDPQYDISWQVRYSKVATRPVLIEVDVTAGQRYRLELSMTAASWTRMAGTVVMPIRRTPISLIAGKTYSFSIKRRSDVIALLCDHRLVCDIPAPRAGVGTVRFASMPAGVTLIEARYQKIGSCIFGDDFMREEALDRFLLRYADKWIEDDIWRVPYYGRDAPGDLQTGKQLTNPWQLSFYPVKETSTNGFWYLYSGSGPSWTVVNPSMMPPFWDRYYVQAAVRPDYQSTVGLLAAYQDNRNYLLFRWKAREYVPSQKKYAELVAMIAGKQVILATSSRGFDPEQWYTLRLNISWHRVQALIDGQVLFDVPNPGPIEGRIGLYADGPAHPTRPALDALTSTMFLVKDEKTGEISNDAADAMRPTSYILYDDVKVGDWLTIDDMAASAYPATKTGSWTTKPDGIINAKSAGQWLTTTPNANRYILSTKVRIPPKGKVSLLANMTPGGTGCQWTLSAKGQSLSATIKGKAPKVLDQSSTGIPENTWVPLRLEVDGPYIAGYCNGKRVIDCYVPNMVAGQCGILAEKAGIQFYKCAVTPWSDGFSRFKVHGDYLSDPWLITWASAEADWVPAVIPTTGVTVFGSSLAEIGPAAPYLTNVPGLYWHKGGFYHDLCVTIPLTPTTIAGQTLYLTSAARTDDGYRIECVKTPQGGEVKFWRRDAGIASKPFPLSAKTRLIVERRGSYLIFRAQNLDTEASAGEPEVLKETQLLAYRDEQPLPATQLGFAVTHADLPAKAIEVQSDRFQDAFEEAPIGWITQSGIWKVMARYSCSPQWNWFGGFGSGTPTAWNKYKLDGDQDVEVYLAVKMLYDDMREEYENRYRDLNMTICGDGRNLQSGYALIRAGHTAKGMVTMLLRKGIVVKTSTIPENLLPQDRSGHRKWYATRITKQGGEIAVYLDNRLAMTYTDPQPLSGGYVGIWTLNNGIMVGRVNFSAERMNLGTPQAASPLIVAEDIQALAVPQVSISGTYIFPASFESGFDGWQERPGFTARIARERVIDPKSGMPNTFIKVVSTYLTGDCSVTTCSNTRDLQQTPLFHSDYCFDPGTQVNLYLKSQGIWYEVILCGTPATGLPCVALGSLPMLTDGQWHHFDADLGKLLTAAITSATGTPPQQLLVDEIVFADWGSKGDLQSYGIGNTPMGTVLRFDNFVLTPRITNDVTVTWVGPMGVKRWKYACDEHPRSLPTTVTEGESLTLPAPSAGAVLHLQGIDTANHALGILHIPLSISK